MLLGLAKALKYPACLCAISCSSVIRSDCLFLRFSFNVFFHYYCFMLACCWRSSLLLCLCCCFCFDYAIENWVSIEVLKPVETRMCGKSVYWFSIKSEIWSTFFGKNKISLHILTIDTFELSLIIWKCEKG